MVSIPDPDDDPSVLHQVVDLLVCLPVGFAFEFRRAAPGFIARGRRELAHGRQVTAQVLHHPSQDVSRKVERLGAHTVTTLRALGVVPRPEPGASAPVDGPSTAADAPTPGATITTAPPRPLTPVRPAVPEIDPETLAIPDYDSLSASQVVPRLESLGGDELETIRRYELGTRGRKTILNKIAQLQAG